MVPQVSYDCGAGGAVGRFVVATRASAYSLDLSDMRAYLVSDPSRVLVSTNRPTRQAGGLVFGAGGSANAVNGYYSAAAVEAAQKSGETWLSFGTSSASQADPWWCVDLGAALPLYGIEITAHPSPSDGQDIAGLEVRLANVSVSTGGEGDVMANIASIAKGQTVFSPLGGAAGRMVILRQPGVRRSLALAQVDVLGEALTISKAAPSLTWGAYTYDAFSTAGSRTLPSGLTTTALLAPLATDFVNSTVTSGCARSGPVAGQSPWLTVDFGKAVSVRRLDILKAGDPSVNSSLNGISVLFGDDPVRFQPRLAVTLGCVQAHEPVRLHNILLLSPPLTLLPARTPLSPALIPRPTERGEEHRAAVQAAILAGHLDHALLQHAPHRPLPHAPPAHRWAAAAGVRAARVR